MINSQSGYRLEVLSYAILAASISLVFWRIHTFSIAHDPAQYIQMGRILAEQSWSSEQAREVLTFVAPGFSLLLGGAIRLFGLWAPYYVNAVLLAGCLILLVRLLKDSGIPSRESHLVAFASLVLLLTGHWQNPYFLLYPFRETLAFFLILTAFALSASARVCSCPWKYVLSGVALLLAIGTREPSVFALPAAALAAVWPTAGQAVRRRLAALILLFSPFVAVVIVAVFAASALGLGPNMQLATWLRVLTNYDVGGMVARTSAGFNAQLLFFIDEAGWWGIALMLGGLVYWRRRASVLLMFFLTGVLLFIFYSHLGEPHRRFFLSSYFFLTPLAGGGLCGLIHEVSQGRYAASIERWATRLAVLVLFGILGFKAAKMTPWGPRVWAREVDQLRELVQMLSSAKEEMQPHEMSTGVDMLGPECAALMRPRMFEAELPFLVRFERKELVGPLFVVEKNNDVLKAALASHTSARFGVQRYVYDEFRRGGAVYFLKPLSEACFFRGRMIPNQGPSVEEFLLQYADITAIKNPDGSPMTFMLGDGSYAVCRVTPWSQSESSLPVPRGRGEASVLSVDTRALSCAGRDEYTPVGLNAGDFELDDRVRGGVAYYALPESLAEDALITLASDGLVPAGITAAWIPPGEAIGILFEPYQFPLPWGLLGRGWSQVGHGWYATGEAELLIPPLIDKSHWIFLELLMSAKAGGSGESRASILRDGVEVGEITLTGDGVARRDVMFIPSEGGVRRHVISLVPHGSKSVEVQLQGLVFRGFAADDPIICNVGGAHDDFALGDGFHRPEGTGNGGRVRWTGGSGSFFLSIPAGMPGFWTVEVVYTLRHRPEQAGPADVIWQFNGQELKPAYLHENVEGWQVASFRLPLRDGAAKSNHLEIRSHSFVPAQLGLGGDQRELGVMIDRVTWRLEPVGDGS